MDNTPYWLKILEHYCFVENKTGLTLPFIIGLAILSDEIEEQDISSLLYDIRNNKHKKVILKYCGTIKHFILSVSSGLLSGSQFNKKEFDNLVIIQTNGLSGIDDFEDIITVLKYFNPSPVVIANSYEAGLSLYKNINTKQYFLTVTVLFKKQSPTELSGNLLIQTSGIKGLSLAPVWHKMINMNGQNVATSMYLLTNRDINELKTQTIKLISFNAYDQPIGLNLTKNKDLLIKQLSKLAKL